MPRTAIATALVVFLLAVSAEVWAALPPQPAPPEDLRAHPNEDKTPVRVSIGLFVTNLASIDEARESFEIGCYGFLSWRDPRLKPEGGDPSTSTSRQLNEQDVWTPPIEAVNTVTHKRQSNSMTAGNDGVVTAVERFNVELSNMYSLRRFPFDRQKLKVVFQPFLSQESSISFDPKPIISDFSRNQEVGLAAWRIDGIKYITSTVSGPGTIQTIPQAIFIIEVKRRAGFYLWKVFLPMLVITALSWSVFWVDPKEFDWEMKIPLATLLALVAFEFTITRDLPRVPYVTFLDAVFLLSYVFIFINAVEITTTFVMNSRARRELAIRIHETARWAFPGGYAVSLVLLIVAFFAHP